MQSISARGRAIMREKVGDSVGSPKPPEAIFMAANQHLRRAIIDENHVCPGVGGMREMHKAAAGHSIFVAASRSPSDDRGDDASDHRAVLWFGRASGDRSWRAFWSARLGPQPNKEVNHVLGPACLSTGGPYAWLSPMQPNPMAETSRPLFPSVRFCTVVLLILYSQLAF